MTGLNTKYIPLNYLQEYFVKIAGSSDIGLPLAGGKIYFWHDNARTIPKDVFKLTGSAPNYNYTNIGSVLTLGANGTFVDPIPGGSDISVYAYPYNSSTLDTDLYFIQVFSSDNEFQFSREAVPNISNDFEFLDNNNNKNYLANGQYSVFNSVIYPDLLTDINPAGFFIFSGPGYANGWGGTWYFGKDNLSSKDTIKLVTIPSGIVIEGSPRYYVDINCVTAGSAETVKRWAFVDQNARQFEQQNITVSFQLKSSTLSSVSFSLVRNFGTGGSPSPNQVIPIGTTINLTTVFEKYSFSALIPTITGHVFGTDGSDSFTIMINLPTNQTFNIGITNAQVNISNNVLKFDEDSFNEQYDRLVSSLIPIPGSLTGSNPYLKNLMPIVYAASLNNSQVGSFDLIDILPIGSYVDVGHDNHLYMNDRGLYECTGRVFSAALCPTFNSLYGRMYGNIGDTTSIVSSNIVTITNVENGPTSNAIDNNTGLTITTTQSGTVSLPQKTQVVCKAASDISNGSYFLFYPRSIYFGSSYFPIIFVKGNIQLKPDGYTGSYYFGMTPVFISSHDNANQVAAKLASVFNHLVTVLPNWNGYFPRVCANGNDSHDPDRLTRDERADGVGGDNVGTTQYWQTQRHVHPVSCFPFETNASRGGSGTYNTLTSPLQTSNTGNNPTGGNQTNPINMYMRRFIKVF